VGAEVLSAGISTPVARADARCTVQASPGVWRDGQAGENGVGWAGGEVLVGIDVTEQVGDRVDADAGNVELGAAAVGLGTQCAQLGRGVGVQAADRGQVEDDVRRAVELLADP
jgi:hypothetical protein